MSRTKAIHEKCRDCIYDPLVPGTWREQVEKCPSVKCPLWPYRPVTIETVNKNRKNRVEDATSIDIDALVAGLEDEDIPEAVA